jgi:mannose-6-phosphate isomerase-like protein (cupin superfamily)
MPVSYRSGRRAARRLDRPPEEHMSDVTSKRIEEIEAYAGPRAIPGIAFRPAARSLGITAWGMNVIELGPDVTGYPEHDHVKDGQEEVYVALRGAGTLRADGEEWPLAPGVLVRVGPAQRRKIVAGPEGVAVLAIGATPGKAYEPRRG